MARNPKVEVVIAGDPKGLNRAFKSSAQHATGFGKVMRGVGRSAAIGFAALGAGAVVAGKHLFDAAQEIENIQNKANIVFGDSIDLVNEWADSNAHAMGQTTNEAISVATSLADVLVPMGFARDEAAGMAVDMADLTGALAAWDSQQRSAAEIGQILTAALTGERDSLKSLGVVITQADVDAKKLEMGMADLTGEADKQASAMATLELIMEGSEDAQTSFAENSDTIGRRMGEARAQMEELRDKIATALIPKLGEAASFILTEVVPKFADLYDWLRVSIPEAIDYLSAKWTEFQDSEFFAGLIESWDDLQTTFNEVEDWLRYNFPEAFEVLGAEVEESNSMFQRWNDWWQDDAGTWRDIYDYFAVDLPNALTHTGDEAETFGGDMWGVGHLVDGVNWTLRGLHGLLTDDLGPVMLAWNYAILPTFQGLWLQIQSAIDNVSAAVAIARGAFDIAKGPILSVLGEWWQSAQALWEIWTRVAGAIQSAIDKLRIFNREETASGLTTFAPGGANAPAGAGQVGPPDPGAPRGLVINVNAGNVLSERDLENTLRDMSRRGLLTPGGAVRS